MNGHVKRGFFELGACDMAPRERAGLWKTVLAAFLTLGTVTAFVGVGVWWLAG